MQAGSACRGSGGFLRLSQPGTESTPASSVQLRGHLQWDGTRSAERLASRCPGTSRLTLSRGLRALGWRRRTPGPRLLPGLLRAPCSQQAPESHRTPSQEVYQGPRFLASWGPFRRFGDGSPPARLGSPGRDAISQKRVRNKRSFITKGKMPLVQYAWRRTLCPSRSNMCTHGPRAQG